MSSDAEFQAAFAKWRADAEAVDLVAFVQARGNKLTRQGREWVGPCPNCGGTDRFSINPVERIFNCRGFGGGGYIDAVMHIDDCDFLTACEGMTGQPPPGRPKRTREGTRRAPAEPKRTPEPDDEAPASVPAQSQAPETDPEPSGRAGRRKSPAELFDTAKLIAGTHAAAYLEARGLPVYPGWTFDMRFHPSLPYLGKATLEDETETMLGKFPALLCAIRNLSGNIIGVHRTYLDPKEPRKMIVPPGTEKINNTKKIVGKAMGGAIRLSQPVTPIMVIGEGVETTRSGALFGIGGEASFWCAVSLGNLAGSATGSLPHPSIAKRTVPNGVPDPERPGLILPPEVEEIIILGDGDSNKPTTFAHLLVAGRRWVAEGRKVFVANAPDGRDWNDLVQEGAHE